MTVTAYTLIKNKLGKLSFLLILVKLTQNYCCECDVCFCIWHIQNIYLSIVTSSSMARVSYA